jgi:hypothetical protein
MEETTVRFRSADATNWDAIWAIIRVVVATGETNPYPPDIGDGEARRLWMPVGAEYSVVWIDQGKRGRC